MARANLSVLERDSQRADLLSRFESLITPNPRLNRSLVSIQANRHDPVFNLFKYKEGFSAAFVHQMINELDLEAGTLLDPFAGSGTSLFAARERGWHAIGVELLPVGAFAIEARLAAESVTAHQFSRCMARMKELDFASFQSDRYDFPHIPITVGAFSPDTERAMSGYRAYCRQRVRDTNLRHVLEFACFSILERISYTRKDGQYLRWDARAGRPRIGSKFHKGHIPGFGEAIHEKLAEIDRALKSDENRNPTLFPMEPDVNRGRGKMDLRIGSCLEVLPAIEEESVDLVVTSPPYCNRYDYTRTYALELAFLNCDADEVKAHRQAMLSCTVENREKRSQMKRWYEDRGSADVVRRVDSVFAQQAALHEVLDILEGYAADGELNNANIPRMIRNYFYEMAFVIFELSRVMRPGGRVVMVNDNVRYAGEEVPVDTILSSIAEALGLRVQHIWKLPRGKGNSSQQMGRHGREEIRKCVYVWEKPQATRTRTTTWERA